MAAGAWIRWPVAVASFVAWFAVPVASGTNQVAKAKGQQGQPDANQIEQDIRYIWPTAMASEPFLYRGEDFGANLAKIALQGYRRYVKEVLPVELKADKAFARDFDQGDSGRLNLAFRRWQKKVWSLRSRTPIPEIDWDGKPIDKVRGVTYDWPELYGAKAHSEFLSRIVHSMHGFFRRMSITKKNDGPPRLKIFTWVEVYEHGDWLAPHVHTGAPGCGVVPLKLATPQSLTFVDPRGKAPPFGHTYEHNLAEGEVVIWPSWAEHYMYPMEGNGTNILVGFLAWFPGGAPDFDWEDDALGDYTYRKKVAFSEKPEKAQIASHQASKNKDEL